MSVTLWYLEKVAVRQITDYPAWVSLVGEGDSLHKIIPCLCNKKMEYGYNSGQKITNVH